MDFSHAGATEPAGVAFRAHVTWYDKGAKRNRNIYGPRRSNEQAAEADLQSMRASANGMVREEGFLAMETTARQLREGREGVQPGSVEEVDGAYRAHYQWRENGVHRDLRGPRRAEKRRAEEDLESLREASVGFADPAARRAALASEAQRLQQQAEREVRVASVARRLSQEQPQQQSSFGQQPQQMSVEQYPVEHDSDSQSDWEPGDADDADVVYPWERFDERGRPLPEQQQQQDQQQEPVASSASHAEPQLQAVARCEQASLGARVHRQDPCFHTLSQISCLAPHPAIKDCLSAFFFCPRPLRQSRLGASSSLYIHTENIVENHGGAEAVVLTLPSAIFIRNT